MSSSAHTSWSPGPARPLLAEDALHVWRADLETVTDDLGELLSDEEHARAERFLAERDGRLWRRSRGVLRALLGRYLLTDPSTLRFTTAAQGKPALAGGAKPCFNLSHADSLALFAITDVGAVGVDVEAPRRPMNEIAVAERALGAGAARRLQELDPARREREFLRLWARHEAELKWRGTGIGESLARHGSEQRSAAQPWIAELDVGERAAAAVALERQPRELRCWLWRP